MIGTRTQMLQLAKRRALPWTNTGIRRASPSFFVTAGRARARWRELDATKRRAISVCGIISPDRPGMSESTFQQDRTLADWPALLNELADQLGIEKFRMLAISGGAPYAYASAWAMPERVEAIAVVSGAPPIAELNDHDGLARFVSLDARALSHSSGTLAKLFSSRATFRGATDSASIAPAVSEIVAAVRCIGLARFARL